jgi:hypothetical protein
VFHEEELSESGLGLLAHTFQLFLHSAVDYTSLGLDHSDYHPVRSSLDLFQAKIYIY